LTGQCKFDGNLFCFFFPPQKKKKETSPTLQHICKPSRADAQTKACKRAAILPAHNNLFWQVYLYFCSMADVHDKKTRSYNMSQIKGKDTKPEILIRKFLFSKGFRYRLYDKKLPGKPDPIKSIRMYAPIAVHVLRFARSRQFIPQNNTALQLKRRKTIRFSSFFILHRPILTLKNSPCSSGNKLQHGAGECYS